MRMIDADVLNKELQKRLGSPIDDKLYEVNLCIINTPTIDAIPVEWLKQWRDKLKGMGEYQRERAEDISFVLGLWQREQEAR